MSSGAAEIIQAWNEATVESLARRVERCGEAITELGARGTTSAHRARDLSKALRAAGSALAFVDADDRDAVVVVLDRLDDLERESQTLLTLWQDDDATRPYDVTVRELAKHLFDDERTRIRPRIIPPVRVLARRKC